MDKLGQNFVISEEKCYPMVSSFVHFLAQERQRQGDVAAAAGRRKPGLNERSPARLRRGGAHSGVAQVLAVPSPGGPSPSSAGRPAPRSGVHQRAQHLDVLGRVIRDEDGLSGEGLFHAKYVGIHRFFGESAGAGQKEMSECGKGCWMRLLLKGLAARGAGESRAFRAQVAVKPMW